MFFFFFVDSKQSKECISFTVMRVLFSICEQIFVIRNSAPIFKCSNFSETILDLVGTLMVGRGGYFMIYLMVCLIIVKTRDENYALKQ